MEYENKGCLSCFTITKQVPHYFSFLVLLSMRWMVSASPDMIDRTISAQLNRDDGTTYLESNWFNLCNLSRFIVTDINFVGVFIDESGSMDRDTVAASLAKLTFKRT